MKAYRKERMSSEVQRIISDAIGHKLNDPRVAPLTTVSRVKLTGDLTIATVYLTVQGDDAAERRTLTAIRHAGGFLQRMLAHELRVRQCPELRFEMDAAAKRARETMRLIAENIRNRPEDPAEAAAPSAGDAKEDESEDDDQRRDGERE